MNEESDAKKEYKIFLALLKYELITYFPLYYYYAFGKYYL